MITNRAHYMIVSETNTKRLVLIVETLLEQGWQLAGGVTVFGFPGGREYTQAMHYQPEAQTARSAPEPSPAEGSRL